MAKKIIIAGGGHGGITCGAILAKNGYDVTIYEKNKADKMGHDWTDIFDPKALLQWAWICLRERCITSSTI